MTDARELAAGASEIGAPRSRPRLTWTDGAGSHFLELKDVRTIGSAPWCELVLMDRAVSRLHAEIAPREDGLWVRDLGSRNGTFVAGVKITEARVPPGAQIRVGTTEIAVAYDTPAPPEGLWPEARFGKLVGQTTAMREIFAMIAELAKGDASVLFVGQTGTGKDALARAMHEASPRAGAPFVVIDCSALPGPVEAAEILEQALRGAEGGTLVLDEPAELPIALQRELIPPLDAKVFRVVATSTRDLRVVVNQGAFREGLYFRLAGATINVPSLQERLPDLPLLLEKFLGDKASLATPDLLADLARVPWIGNLRELELYAERLRATDGESREFPEPAEPFDQAVPTIEAEFATMEVPIVDTDQAAALAGTTAEPPRLPPQLEPWFETGFKEFRERWIELGEREYLRRLMKRTNRSSSTASREAGLERTYLYRLLKKHGV
ncbi:MAG: sigma 54-dependent Fis family transcriptional regulator [Labilithrix sp.]|nr:sigma 54-dependent Fis family transcriptional regulator [Labilithrix sp.]